MKRLVLLLWAAAAPLLAAEMPPLLPPAGHSEYREYLESPDHRAFAIAPGGAWGWVSGQASTAAAQAAALETCQAHTSQRCVPYAADGRVVFDAKAWPALWGPYATAAQARKASVGREPGQRMADLAFADPRGRRLSVGAFKGKVTLLHFWGSWCAPCRKEMPELQQLAERLADRRDVAFVLLQARESAAVSRRWAEAQKISLPLYDSGSAGDEDAQFTLASGRRVPDREIANRFPTTYVIDKRGIVVFAHVGPVHEWPRYEAFLRDVADRSGR